MENVSLFYVKFLGPFKNGFNWSSTKLIEYKDGNYHIIDKSKYNLVLVPEGETMWHRFSVPKNKIKIIKRVIK